MKKLQITQMEGLQGGWDWGKALGGCGLALGTANTTGALAYATLATGPVGGAIAAGATCLAGGLLGGTSK